MLCAQEKAWKEKNLIQTWSFTLTLFLSLHFTTLAHCNLTIQKFNTAAGHQVSGIQTTSELLRESIYHPASPENSTALTQAGLGEGIRVQ